MTHERTFRGGFIAGVALAGMLVGMLALFATVGWSPTSATAAQAQYAPVNTVAPTISGTPAAGHTLTANEGTWTGDQPLVYTYQWHRCNPGGQACVAIPGATGKTYAVQAADVGATLRAEVRATNTQGSSAATSAQTAVVAAESHPEGAVTLPNGQISIPASSVNPPERLLIERVEFTPNVVSSRTAPLQARVLVRDTRGYVVRGALVFLRSVPIVTTTPPEQATGDDGWITYTLQPRAGYRVQTGYNIQFFVRARKQGDNLLTGVSIRRLVQVTTRSS
jgi:hypothetical protein